MNGRLEKDFKQNQKTESELTMLPRFITDWYYYLKANDKTAATCKAYIEKARHFLQYINNKVWRITPDDITDDLVIRYFIDIKTKSIEENGKTIIEYTSDSYRQTVWSCLNNLFDFLESQGEIPYNFIRKAKISRPKTRQSDVINKNKDLLTEEDFKSMLDAVSTGAGSKKAKSFQKRFQNRDKCILELLMTTGMRKGALLTINAEDIDMENKTLSVIDKGEIVHEYYLSDHTIKTIDDWLIDRTLMTCGVITGALFISRYGERISERGLDKIISKYSYEALNYSISPHKIRSGFISIIQEQKHDIEFTRRAAGHRNITTTQGYIVTKNNERKEASVLMEQLLKEG